MILNFNKFELGPGSVITSLLYWGLITNICLILALWHGWVITSHYFTRMQLLIHARIPMMDWLISASKRRLSDNNGYLPSCLNIRCKSRCHRTPELQIWFSQAIRSHTRNISIGFYLIVTSCGKFPTKHMMMKYCVFHLCLFLLNYQSVSHTRSIPK